mmetsp:Transcript_287/g.439  ORF Transcript_287/g.439 Transcript_287/m.439 type:complete len:90 (+) Transcript_287:34-303(+)
MAQSGETLLDILCNSDELIVDIILNPIRTNTELCTLRCLSPVNLSVKTSRIAPVLKKVQQPYHQENACSLPPKAVSMNGNNPVEISFSF